MERGNTKQEILHAALHLFSVQGFEATSVAQIAVALKTLIQMKRRNQEQLHNLCQPNQTEQETAETVATMTTTGIL